MSALSRIDKLKLLNYRGWGSQGGAARTIHTDADIVLITGANGLGKSSLLEAIVQLVTGYRVHPPHPGEAAGGPGELAHQGAERWQLAFEGVLDDATKASATLEWKRDGDPPTPDGNWQVILRQRLSGEDDAPRRTFARAMSFFQDDPSFNLRTDKSDDVLDAWFSPLTPALEALRDKLRREVERLRSAEETARSRYASLSAPPEGYDEAIAGLAKALRKHVAAVFPARAARAVPHLDALRGALIREEGPDLDPILGLVGILEDEARERGRDPESPPRDAIQRLQGVLRILSEDALPAEDLARARERLAAVERELEELPPAEEEERFLTWLQAEPSGERAPISLVDALGALAAGRERWIRGTDSAPKALVHVLQELERVDQGALSRLAASARTARDGARDAASKREQLHDERGRLRAQLERHALPRALDEALERTSKLLGARQDRLARRAQLANPEEIARQYAVVEQLDDRLTEALGTPTSGVEKLIGEVLDRTLVRFQMRKGMLPVREAREDLGDGRRGPRVLRSADGRPWTDASTGQKAQIALARMLAYAYALRNQLPARVLVLDDTSTAFDQGNLARQATWLRQLAYHPDGSKRWQVFLASHHDELTSRLVEKLSPPPGRSLRVLEFTDWKPGFGPTIQPWTLSHPSSGSTDCAFADKIARAWFAPELPHDP